MSENTSASAPTGPQSKNELKRLDEESQVETTRDLEEDLIVEGVPPEKAALLIRRVVTLATSRFHSGPLPPVEDFDGYERVCPGASRDILDMAIREQKHLHEIQLIEVKGQLSLNKLGILGGIFLVGLMLFSTVYCAMHGQKEVAIAIATGAGFIGVAGVFLRNYLTKSPPPASSPPIGGDDDDDDDDDPAATSLDRTA